MFFLAACLVVFVIWGRFWSCFVNRLRVSYYDSKVLNCDSIFVILRRTVGKLM